MSLIFTEADRQTPAFMKLMKHLDERKLQLTGQLAGDMTEEQTWKFRGRIAEINGLLAVNDPDPQVVSDFI